MSEATEPAPFADKANGWSATDVGAAAGAAVTVGSLLALTVLLYHLPDNVQSGWGLFQPAVRHFRESLGLGETTTFEPESFCWWFRALLGSAWAGYVAAVVAGLRGGVVPARLLLGAIGAIVFVLAVACPPCLSYDVYGYVGDARLEVTYGRNPYQYPPSFLQSLDDPWAEFMLRPMPTVYGPVWLLLDFAAAATLGWGNLWLNVAALKLLAGAALLGMAWTGRALARQFGSGREELTLLAIGLNPLFLLEGPGSGHNDLLMMALLMGGLLCWQRRRDTAGALLIGLAVGIESAPAALAPWLIGGRVPEQAPGLMWRRTLGPAFLLLAPTALCYLPLAANSSLGEMLQAHTARGLDAAALARDAAQRDWLRERGLPPAALAAAMLLLRQWPILLLYGGLTIWVLRSRAEDRLLNAWSVLALGLIVFTLGVWYPWYLVWPWSVALTRWDRWPLYLSTTCLVLGVALTMRYSYVW